MLENIRLRTDPKQTNQGDDSTYDPDPAGGDDVEDEAAKLEREIAELDAVIAAQQKRRRNREAQPAADL